MVERGFFFKKLIDMGLDLKIFGTGWKKDKNYESLKSRITFGQVPLNLCKKEMQARNGVGALLKNLTR